MWANLIWKIYVVFSVVIVSITLLTAITLVIAEIAYYERVKREYDKLPHKGKKKREKDDF